MATPAGTAINSADLFVPPAPFTASDVVSTSRTDGDVQTDVRLVDVPSVAMWEREERNPTRRVLAIR